MIYTNSLSLQSWSQPNTLAGSQPSWKYLHLMGENNLSWSRTLLPWGSSLQSCSLRQQWQWGMREPFITGEPVVAIHLCGQKFHYSFQVFVVKCTHPLSIWITESLHTLLNLNEKHCTDQQRRWTLLPNPVNCFMTILLMRFYNFLMKNRFV